jgi:glycosyltransferase involved in cell wall biosynthesis
MPAGDDAPLVSVVVPTWQRSGPVLGAVESCLAQEGVALEVLVVDDGSTDDTVARVRERFGGEARVRLLEKENAGCPAARNHGIEHARGRYVALLDSDDRCLPGRLARQAAVLSAAGAPDLCICDALFDRGEGRGRVRMTARRGWRAPTSARALLEGAWAVPSTWMLVAEVARVVRFDPSCRYEEDVDFLFRFHEAGYRAALLPEPLVLYDDRPGPAGAEPRMTARQADMDRWALEIFEREAARLPEDERRRLEPPARIRRAMLRRAVAAGRWREARAHLLATWRTRPLRLSLLLRWLAWLPRRQPAEE